MTLKRYLLLFTLILSWFGLSHSAMASDDDYARVAGAVFTATNSADGNKVLMYQRSARGKLTFVDAFATGGLGSGSLLANQGAMVLSKNNRWLFVVNAGSDELSVFLVRRNRLILRDKIYSGGSMPTSVTFDRGLIYVLNDASDSISGFILSRRGKLFPLANSTRSLSGSGTGPAQISFTPDGDTLVVTEKVTNLIDTFVLDEHGIPGEANIFASVGATPFGFAFDRRGRMIVSEAAGGLPDISSVSSYNVSETGGLSVITGGLANTQTAACWIAITGNGRFAYSTNTGSSSVSGYRIARDGSLSLLDADGRTGDTGPGTTPVDMAFSRNSRYLYTLSTVDGSINSFRVRRNGSLKNLESIDTPPFVNGMAAY